MARRRFVVIGDGAAGLAAAERLRREDPSALIGLFTEDPSPGYYRAALTNYLLGELREDQLWAVAPDYYESRGMRRVFGRVVAVDTKGRLVWDATSPTPTPYDELLVASGGRPRPPVFEGAHLPGVMTLRTIKDAREVVDHLRLRRLSRAVVLGGGALGLEWAHALAEHGVRVTIVERAPRFLPNALDEVASDLLAARLRQAGIDIVLGDAVAVARPDASGAVGAVITERGQTLECGLVAAALGVVPASDFLKGSGVELTEGGGIVTGRTMATNVPGVWAAGDVASVEGKTALQLWEPARQQGRVAAAGMLGKPERYAPGVHYFATRLFDLDFARLGAIERAPGRFELVDFPRGTGTIAYRKLVVEGGRLIGALMIGERGARARAAGRRYKRLIDSRADVGSVLDRLLDPTFDCDAWLRTQRLFEAPRAMTMAARVAAPAKLRGTQALKIAGGGTAHLGQLTRAVLGGARPPAPDGTLAVAGVAPGAPRGTRLLSIGLRAEEAKPLLVDAPPLDARFEGLGRVFAVGAAGLGIGRGSDCEIVIEHESVATLHARVLRHGATLYLRDTGSRTGTWVNETLVTRAHELADGDRVRIGPAELCFRSPTLARRAALAPELVTLPHLEVRSGQSLGLSFALRGPSLLIGSAPGAAIELRDLSVAPQHARLRVAGEQVHVSDLGSGRGTFLGFQALAPGQEVPLAEGASLRVGIVELVYTRRPVATPAGDFRPRALVRVDGGPALGSVIELGERAIFGSDPRATLCIAGLAPAHVEIALFGQGFAARDLSGGRTFRSGSPLAAEPTPLAHGDMLLCAGSTLLRFEDLP